MQKKEDSNVGRSLRSWVEICSVRVLLLDEDRCDFLCIGELWVQGAIAADHSSCHEFQATLIVTSAERTYAIASLMDDYVSS